MKRKLSRRFCIACNGWDSLGKEGEEGTEAKGYYYLPRKGGNQAFSGKIPVCEKHMGDMQIQGFYVFYWNGEEYKKPETKTTVQLSCVHEWDKKSLVTEEGGYDIMICRKCKLETKRYGVGGGDFQ